MKRLMIIAAAAALAGCATGMTSQSFFEQEALITRECMAAVNSMPLEKALEVNRTTGRSPLTDGASCYAHRAAVAAWAGGYPNAQIVEDFGNYLVKLTTSHDQGIVDTPTALTNYRESAAQFRKMIDVSDAKESVRRNQEFREKFGVFLNRMHAVTAEQERLRAQTYQSSRPVICSPIGTYGASEVVCQ